MNGLTAQQLGVSRDGRRLLGGIDLDIAGGELHVLLGPNGAGKSTLLRTLSGEWPYQEGEIRLAGRLLRAVDIREQARLRAVLPQYDALSFGFTVRELVLLGRHGAADRRPAVDRRIVDEVLQATDTASLAGRLYTTLSGGERRRAQLARVLAQVWDLPQALLLLDEPIHSLDLGHQHAVMHLLHQLATRGFAVLASLHDLNLAAAYAHRLSLLEAGHLIASGEPDEVLAPQLLQRLYGQDLQFTAAGDGAARHWIATHRPSR